MITGGGRKDAPAGFTLLEILVAVTILGMAYLVILQNFSMSLRNIERIEVTGGRNFASELEMEKHFMAHDVGEEVDGEVFVKGGKYQVVMLASESDRRLVTLVIKEQ